MSLELAEIGKHPYLNSSSIPVFGHSPWFTKTVRYLTRPIVAALVALFILANGGGATELVIGAILFALIDLGSRYVVKRLSRT